MKATVVWLRDEVLTVDEHQADTITVKILADGRAYVTTDGDITIYRRADRIHLQREGRPDALTPREDA